jgi:isoleucyl-tRNA synthetase
LISGRKKTYLKKSVTTREGNEPFVFLKGHLLQMVLPGIHHVMARAIKDILVYKTQKGTK